jgi:sirohydrochlorin cobaltochelatase
MTVTSSILSLLTERLQTGPFTIGQIAVAFSAEGRAELRHHADAGRPATELASFTDPYAAREIAQYDATGEYRPLKGTPDLKSGWRLDLAGPAEVRIALDVFYPAALAVWAADCEGRLRVIPLSQTLERQTGMYRYARTISPEGAQGLTRSRCLEGCSRRPLWSELASKESQAGELPLLCPEACSFFVAEARVVAKAEFEAKAAANPEPAA